MAASFADEVFHEVAYKAHNRDHLIAGLDEFLDLVTVLPPGEWDPSIRIEPPTSLPSQRSRVDRPGESDANEKLVDEEEEKLKIRQDAGLVRSGRLFGGLLNDIKRKKPHYLSDFRDGLSMQSVSTIIFLYFANLAPIVAFGGLLGDATENRMASIEALVSGLIAGVMFGLFSGQPLTILGLTGPDLVFESLVYQFCVGFGWEYLSFRIWIGLWLATMLIILVATDASFSVCYITRFTEECFACLIAIIFIIKAVQSTVKIGYNFPINPSPCLCVPGNYTHLIDWSKAPSAWCNTTVKVAKGGEKEEGFVFTVLGIKSTDGCQPWTTSSGGLPASAMESICNTTLLLQDGSQITAFGQETIGCHYKPNVFFMSCLLFIGTYLIATAQGLQEPEVLAQRLPLLHLELCRDHRHRDHGGR